MFLKNQRQIINYFSMTLFWQFLTSECMIYITDLRDGNLRMDILAHLTLRGCMALDGPQSQKYGLSGE